MNIAASGLIFVRVLEAVMVLLFGAVVAGVVLLGVSHVFFLAAAPILVGAILAVEWWAVRPTRRHLAGEH